jgi:uncharacterized membrane protein
MSSITKSIDVNVPVRTAYNQWTQFEEFPQFMEGVQEVTQLDATHLQWRATIGGREATWEAVVTEQEPDLRVAWKSTSGAPNAGVVTFHRLGEHQTRVTLQLEYDSAGAVENVGDALGFVSRRVQGDLEWFKAFIEARGAARSSRTPPRRPFVRGGRTPSTRLDAEGSVDWAQTRGGVAQAPALLDREHTGTVVRAAA